MGSAALGRSPGRFDPRERLIVMRDATFQFVENFRLFFQKNEGFQFLTDKIEIQLAMVPGKNVIDVKPIQFAIGKAFVNDQILGATRGKIELFQKDER